MDRRAITTFVSANNGTILRKTKTYTAYSIKMSDSKFLDFRAKIPFVTVWYSGTNNKHLFGVFFDELKDY